MRGGELDADAVAAALDRQLQLYERDKIACRFKLCCCAQLLASSWYAVASPLTAGYKFGGLCVCTGLLGFFAAQRGSRLALRLSLLLSIAVVAAAACLLKAYSDCMRDLDEDRYRSSHTLLECFRVLTALLALLQIPMLRACASLIAEPARRPSHSHAVGGAYNDDLDGDGESSQLLSMNDEVLELLHVDLSRTPPEMASRQQSLGMKPMGLGGRLTAGAASGGGGGGAAGAAGAAGRGGADGWSDGSTRTVCEGAPHRAAGARGLSGFEAHLQAEADSLESAMKLT